MLPSGGQLLVGHRIYLVLSRIWPEEFGEETEAHVGCVRGSPPLQAQLPELLPSSPLAEAALGGLAQLTPVF